MAAKEIFAIRLYELREDKMVSRQKVADDLGITRASLDYYEKGQRTPDVNTIVKIADYFEVSVDYLLGLTDEKNRYAVSAHFAEDAAKMKEHSRKSHRKDNQQNI